YHDVTLKPGAIQHSAFGVQWRRQVRGSTYAQPLFVKAVDLPGLIHPNPHDLVIVATMHNMVYAFDANDSSQNALPVWKTNLRYQAGFSAPPTPLPQDDIGQGPGGGLFGGSGYRDIRVEIGILSTPVVSDPDANGQRFIFVVAHATDSGGHFYVAYKLNLSDGTIAAANRIPNQGLFSAANDNQRPALLLDNGFLYVAYASYGDQHDYHGFVQV